MRALLSTIGSRGDVQPLVALATELRALGQEVRMCAPPDFREWIESLGIAVTPIGPEVRQTATSRPSPSQAAAPPSPEQRRQVGDATVATQFETITAAASGCDIVVAATALQVAARSVAEKIGVPYVFVAYSPNVLPSTHHAPSPLPPLPGQTATATSDNRVLWARDSERFNDLFAAPLNAHRASLGLAPVSDVRSHMLGDVPWLAADLVLAPWPDPADHSVLQTGAWILADERPLPRELETFLANSEPPVFFGFGSMRTPDDLSQVMMNAARAHGRRAVVSRGWAELTPADNAPDCLSVGEVNFQALFTRVAAVVHHGGAGTTTIAALAGAPQVVVPQIYDQHYWAQRIHDLGIGFAHAPGAPAVASLTAALEYALKPDVAARARSIAAAMRRDGAKIAARRLIGTNLS